MSRLCISPYKAHWLRLLIIWSVFGTKITAAVTGASAWATPHEVQHNICHLVRLTALSENVICIGGSSGDWSTRHLSVSAGASEACSPAQGLRGSLCLGPNLSGYVWQNIQTVVCKSLASLCLPHVVEMLGLCGVFELSFKQKTRGIVRSSSALVLWSLTQPLTALINSNHILCFELNQPLITELLCLRF